MNTAGLPVYHIDASVIQALLSHASYITGGTTQGTTQESKKGEGKTYFNVSEGEKIHTKKMFGLEESAGDDDFPIWYIDLFTKNQDKKDKPRLLPRPSKNTVSSITPRYHSNLH